jgi:hypothetical protein
MSMIPQIIKMMRLRKPMNNLSHKLQENNDRELLLMLEDLLFWAIGMEVMVVAMVEEEVLEIESEHAESDEEDDPKQHWSDGNQRRGCYA